MDLPWWASEGVSEFENPGKPWNGVTLTGNWTEHSEEMFSTVKSIHYPTRAHVFYVVDMLEDGGTWKELTGIYYTEELADNNAKRHAYEKRVPHRVRLVVSYE